MRRGIHETDQIHREEGAVVRHSLLVQIQHWLVAVSGLVLVFTGIGSMPVYKRYMLDQVPGMAWSSDFIVNYTAHMIAAMVFVFAAIFHLVYHYIEGGRSILPMKGDVKESFLIIKAILTGKAEPPSKKFLAEQRLAYAFIAFSIALLIVTGIFKFIDNLPSVNMPHAVSFWNTTLHNIGMALFLLGFFAHVGAFLIKANWPLLKSIFTGRVSVKYAEHRHPLWVSDMESGEAVKGKMTVECIVRVFAGVMISTGVLLGAVANPWWYLLPAFVGLNLIQSAFTHWCPLEGFLRRLGYPSSRAEFLLRNE